MGFGKYFFCVWMGLVIYAGSQCTRRPVARHVIFISLDTTRPDHLGCYGNPWISTPHLDRLATESIRFAHYMTVVPTTLQIYSARIHCKYPRLLSASSVVVSSASGRDTFPDL